MLRFTCSFGRVLGAPRPVPQWSILPLVISTVVLTALPVGVSAFETFNELA